MEREGRLLELRLTREEAALELALHLLDVLDHVRVAVPTAKLRGTARMPAYIGT